MSIFWNIIGVVSNKIMQIWTYFYPQKVELIEYKKPINLCEDKRYKFLFEKCDQ